MSISRVGTSWWMYVGGWLVEKSYRNTHVRSSFPFTSADSRMSRENSYDSTSFLTNLIHPLPPSFIRLDSTRLDSTRLDSTRFDSVNACGDAVCCWSEWHSIGRVVARRIATLRGNFSAFVPAVIPPHRVPKTTTGFTVFVSHLVVNFLFVQYFLCIFLRCSFLNCYAICLCNICSCTTPFTL